MPVTSRPALRARSGECRALCRPCLPAERARPSGPHRPRPPSRTLRTRPLEPSSGRSLDVRFLASVSGRRFPRTAPQPPAGKSPTARPDLVPACSRRRGTPARLAHTALRLALPAPGRALAAQDRSWLRLGAHPRHRDSRPRVTRTSGETAVTRAPTSVGVESDRVALRALVGHALLGERARLRLGARPWTGLRSEAVGGFLPFRANALGRDGRGARAPGRRAPRCPGGHRRGGSRPIPVPVPDLRISFPRE